MKGQLHTIEMYMLIVGVSLLVGIMFSIYGSSVNALSTASQKRITQLSLMDVCSSFTTEEISTTGKTIGELMSIYNLTGNDLFVFEDKYSINLTKKINYSLESMFGDRWNFSFGAMNLGHTPPGKTLGCRIYVPSPKTRGYTYAILRIW